MTVTRFTVLPDKRGLILGIDTRGTFKKGVVYEASELMGEIVLRPVGPMAMDKDLNEYSSSTSKVGTQLQVANHLITIEEHIKNYEEDIFNCEECNGEGTLRVTINRETFAQHWECNECKWSGIRELQKKALGE